MNILIYDVAGSHFNKVRDTFLHFCDVEVNVLRAYFGFGFDAEESLSDYVVSNNVDVVIVPYKPIQMSTFTSVIESGAQVIMPHEIPFGQSWNAVMRSVIRASGGTTQAITNQNTIGIEYYTECENLTGEERVLDSYVVGKIGGLFANLLDNYENIWDARQALRQNASSYPIYNIRNGFGKIGATATIPETLQSIPPVDVTLEPPTTSSLNQGLGVLQYKSKSGNITLTGTLEQSASESPIIIQGEDKSYSVDYRIDYGGVFTANSFELGEYNATEVPKKPEILRYSGSQSNQRRFRLGILLNDNQVPAERRCDRVFWRVKNASGTVIASGVRPYNKDEILFESFNNPDFSLTNSGNTYFFEFKTENVFGESEWSEPCEVLDITGISPTLFDFASEPEPSEPAPPQPPPPQPEPDPLPAVRPIVTDKQRTANEITLTIEDNFPQAIIQRRSPSGTFETIATTADAEFTDTVPDSTQTYIYRLANTNEEVQSEFSDLIYVAGIRTETTLFPCTTL
jgi:hypothetical protein